uniref:Anti-virus transcriptional factor n=1 Tax=Solanum tuberosum TaxID=4113 RepID=M1AUX6_SOLTU
MVSDSIPTPMASDFVKKKRANRSAKLKQCKLYARRDQWLSQGSCLLIYEFILFMCISY